MYEQTLRLAPDFRDVTANIAVCLAALGRFSEARGPAIQALKDGPGDVKVMRTIIEIAAAEVRAGKVEQPPGQPGSPRSSGKVPGLTQKAPDHWDPTHTGADDILTGASIENDLRRPATTFGLPIAEWRSRHPPQ